MGGRTWEGPYQAGIQVAVMKKAKPQLGSAQGVLAADKQRGRTGGVYIVNSKCYIYSSFSRIILKGYSHVSILKTAPNSHF
jgi:hypothetical protein